MSETTHIDWRPVSEDPPAALFEEYSGTRARGASLLMWYRRGKSGFWSRGDCIAYPHSPLKWPQHVTHWAPDLEPPEGSR